MNKEVQRVIAELRKRYTVVYSRRSHHYKVYDGKQLISSFASTPSDYNSTRNSMRYVTRYERSKSNDQER